MSYQLIYNWWQITISSFNFLKTPLNFSCGTCAHRAVGQDVGYAVLVSHRLHVPAQRNAHIGVHTMKAH